MPEAGLYLHIPFCRKKCAYCDFYSSFASETLIDEYVAALIKEIRRWGGCFGRPIDTIYIGGGTPSLLGRRITELLGAVCESFEVAPNSEITVEMNPEDRTGVFLSAAADIGVNRLSIGIQSGDDTELQMLGRGHTADDAAQAVNAARKHGFKNISLDLMLGLPNGSCGTLLKSLEFLTSLSPEHISAYILKVESATRFGKHTPPLPDDEEQARQYLMMCEELSKRGYGHYEISNFAKEGFESRHNLKYWRGQEYLGIGPAAHSFVNGERFFYERDLKKFIRGPETVADGLGGDAQEKMMLALRLREGVDVSAYPQLEGFLSQLQKAGLAELSQSRLSLTDRGMLVSNSIITEILERIT